MTPERWQEVKRLFDAALERPPAERREFLDEACRDDPGLDTEVTALGFQEARCVVAKA